MGHTKVRPATVGERFGSHLCDWIVFYLLNGLTIVPALFATSRSAVLLLMDLGMFVSFLIVYVIPLRLRGRTFGQSGVDVQVQAPGGRRPGVARALVRQLGWSLAPLTAPLLAINLFLTGRSAWLWFPGVLFLLGLVSAVWCIWDRPHRDCLHDKVAGTRVVHAPDSIRPRGGQRPAKSIASR